MKKLIQIRAAQQKYMLAAEKVRQYEKMLSGADDMLLREYRKQVEECRKEMTETRIMAEEYIRMLDRQAEREVLTRRYLFCETWEKIASEMHYSMKQIQRIHKKALIRIAEKCP